MRKILCIVLAFLICSFSIYVYAEDVTDLQTKQEELKDQIDQQNEELEQVQSELSQNLQQVQKLDEKISSSEKEVEELNEKITNLQSSIEEVEEKLKIEEETFEKRKKIYKARLIATYKAGETKYLDVLLGSKNISEFLSNYFLISEVASMDKQLLDEIESRKDEIDLTKQKLEKDKEELATLKQTQVKTAKILQNSKIVRESYIEKLTEEEKQKQEQIDEMERQYAEINSEILSLVLQGVDTKYIGGELAWPTPGYTRITSEYGMRVHPITKVYKLHTGVDIGAPMGANFVAANDGVVIKAEYNTAYGRMVVIDHGGGISTLYAHGSEILVQVGQTVKRNDPVLKVGSTGYSTGAHAHFEVRINGVVTNPMPYITNGVIPDANSNTESQED